MSAAVQDVLDVVVEDHRPSRVDTREAIRLAVLKAAADRRGLVHIAAVRRHLPSWVSVEQIGAVTNRLVRRGYLIPTGRYEPNGDRHARNASKPAAVRRLVRPIPPEALR
jgi:hypothetical protein